MAISRLSLPWLNNVPILYQLWDGQPIEGNELDLSNSTDRALMVMWRDRASQEIVLQREEGDEDFPLTIIHALRGVVELRVVNPLWEFIERNTDYDLIISAYGAERLTVTYTSRIPEAEERPHNGVKWYASPREVEEVLGPVPGVTGEVSVRLTGWTENALGYYEASFPSTELFGLWADDKNIQKCSYAELATQRGEWFAQVGDRAIVKANSPLSERYVETAKTRYILRTLEEATRDIERKTTRFFNKRWVIRETQRTLQRQRQLTTRHSPVHLSDFLRLDTYSLTRNLFARYSKEDFAQFNEDKTFNLSGQSNLHLEADTGIITLNQNFFDIDGSAYGFTAGLQGLGFFPPGENNLEISYEAGFDSPPVGIAEATANLAAIRLAIFFKQQITGGADAVQLGCANLNLQNLFASFVPQWQQTADFIVSSYQQVDISPI